MILASIYCPAPLMARSKFGQLISEHVSQRIVRRRRVYGAANGYQRLAEVRLLLQQVQIGVYHSTERPQGDRAMDHGKACEKDGSRLSFAHYQKSGFVED